jgi:hypothetical protein
MKNQEQDDKFRGSFPLSSYSHIFDMISHVLLFIEVLKGGKGEMKRQYEISPLKEK